MHRIDEEKIQNFEDFKSHESHASVAKKICLMFLIKKSLLCGKEFF
jgi:hypothetical protein